MHNASMQSYTLLQVVMLCNGFLIDRQKNLQNLKNHSLEAQRKADHEGGIMP